MGSDEPGRKARVRPQGRSLRSDSFAAIQDFDRRSKERSAARDTSRAHEVGCDLPTEQLAQREQMIERTREEMFVLFTLADMFSVYRCLVDL